MTRWLDDDIQEVWANLGSFEPGEQLGADYEIVRLLGKGGEAEVYEVKNNKDGHSYVAKIFIRDEGNRNFEREQKVFIRLKGTETNPHIVHSHPATGIGDRKVLVLDFLRGPTVQECLRENGPSASLAKWVIRDVLRALDEIHKRGIVHRDVKPSNIKLVGKGERRRAVLFDFGIAAEINDEEAPEAGSRGYIPPERGSHPARDIFSVGSLLHEIATGRKPVWERGLTAPVDRHDRVVPPPELSNHPILTYCLQKSLEHKPQKRFGSAGEFENALSTWRIPVTAGSWLARTARNRYRWLAVFTCVATLVGFISAFVTRHIVEPPLLERIFELEGSEVHSELGRFKLNPDAQRAVAERILRSPDVTANDRRFAEDAIKNLGRQEETVEEYDVRGTVRLRQIQCEMNEGVETVQLHFELSVEGAEKIEIALPPVPGDPRTRRSKLKEPIEVGGWTPGAKVTAILEWDPSSWPGNAQRFVVAQSEDREQWSSKVLQPEPSGRIEWEKGILQIDGELDLRQDAN